MRPLTFKIGLKQGVSECLINSATSIIHHMSIDFAVNFAVKIILPYLKRNQRQLEKYTCALTL